MCFPLRVSAACLSFLVGQVGSNIYESLVRSYYLHIPMLACLYLPSATNVQFVLGGQHMFEACCRIVNIKEKASERVPKCVLCTALCSFPPCIGLPCVECGLRTPSRLQMMAMLAALDVCGGRVS